MTRLLSAALTAAALTALFAQPTTAEPFTAKLMASLDRLDDPRVSPDGKYVLYDLRTVDFGANKSAHALWLLDLKTKATRKLAISQGGTSSGRWGADGNIYFISSRSGTAQVYRTGVKGEKAVQVTHAELDVGAFKLSPDSKTLVISQTVFPDCKDIACTVERNKAKETQKTTGVVYDRVFVRHWDEWADGTRNHLYALHLNAQGIAEGAPIALMADFDGDAPTKPFGGDGDFDISPDSKTLVFSAKIAGKSEPWTTNFDLWQVPLDGSKAPVDLTPTNPAWDAAPAFSPDGKWLAYSAMKRPGFEADRFGLMLRNVATGETHEVAPNWDHSAEGAQWSHDGKRILVASDDIGQHKVFSIDPMNGKVSALTGQGHVGGFDQTPKGLVFAQDTLTSPAQLYVQPFGGKATRLTHLNADKLKDVPMGAPEQFSFTGWNGETVHGYVVKPAGYQPGKKYPVALLIHGGPQGSMANNFHYRWNAQVYAGAGYAAVMIDFHGSTGYGQAFTDSISQHWGDRPLEDLQKGWSYALDKYDFLDGKRACALGGSYGGFMVNWIAGNWSAPFKCLVSHDGVFDSRGMGYATEELWFDEWERGGTVYDVPQNYERFNPINHVKAWDKPILFVQGGRDYRIPLDQAIGAFTIAQRRGVESKLLYFPDENHWVLKPQNSVQWHDEVLSWLNTHTK
ncbi:acylaminoacyl-peptidase [Rhizomicrobium palustre]|uniref:Acylaminoacyl-peptidase n=1 Tax=Rhizomicrobium palustre TaxID=189966 RepID=A0A846N3M5_9PROT|nr:S9 family peptidase [Rhizomicrobium palustre]NIK89851.1 acylaminoacyl-peptidase [Rhizomicrobium palustre]